MGQKSALDESTGAAGAVAVAVAVAVAGPVAVTVVAGVTWRCHAPFVSALIKSFEIMSSLFVGFISGAGHICSIPPVEFSVRLIGKYLKKGNNVFWFICVTLVMKYMKCFAL